MNEEDLYKFTLEYLSTRTRPANLQFDIGRVVDGVNDIAIRVNEGPRDGSYFLSDQQRDIVNEIVWDLIVQRVVTIDKQGYPWLRVTDYGKKVVQNIGPTPYDRDGYLTALKNKSSNISPLAVDYIREAITCFRSGAQRAASVMLGVASEEIFSDMIRAFEQKYSVQMFSPTYKPFKQIKDLFEAQFEKQKNDLPKDLKNNIDNTIGGVYELIKKMRDDSGHPTSVNISRDEVNANFSVLPLYVERIYKVVEFYSIKV